MSNTTSKKEGHVSPNKTNPKVDQFLADINKVCDHYQYSLQPQLRMGKDGIFPVLNIIDRPPKPMDDPTPESPALETPVEQPAPVSETPAETTPQEAS